MGFFLSYLVRNLISPILRHSGMIHYYRNIQPKHDTWQWTSLNPHAAKLAFLQQHKNSG